MLNGVKKIIFREVIKEFKKSVFRHIFTVIYTIKIRKTYRKT